MATLLSNIIAPSSIVTLSGTQTLTNKTVSNGVLTGTLTAGGTTGTSGQVLQSTGTGLQWATVSGGGGSVILTVNGDSGTDTVTVGTDSLTFVGGTGITSTVTNNTVTFDADTTLTTKKLTIGTRTVSTTIDLTGSSSLTVYGRSANTACGLTT